jgi:hypothetical protein
VYPLVAAVDIPIAVAVFPSALFTPAINPASATSPDTTQVGAALNIPDAIFKT